MSAERTYVGIGGHVVAIDPRSGSEYWRTKIGSSGSFVTVTVNVPFVLAACSGEIFGLDPADGRVLWHNPLKGLGVGYVTFAGTDAPPAGDAAASAASSTAAAAAVISST